MNHYTYKALKIGELLLYHLKITTITYLLNFNSIPNNLCIGFIFHLGPPVKPLAITPVLEPQVYLL